jgi:hypothetical protein
MVPQLKRKRDMTEEERNEKLDRKLVKYIEITESEDYKRGQTLVNAANTLKTHIRDEFKERELEYRKVIVNNEEKTVKFKIRTRPAIRVADLPDEIMEEYGHLMEIWLININENEEVQMRNEE